MECFNKFKQANFKENCKQKLFMQEILPLWRKPSPDLDMDAKKQLGLGKAIQCLKTSLKKGIFTR